MLDNLHDDLPEDFEDTLGIARAARTLLRAAVGDDHERLLAVLGAMLEGTLKDIEDPDEQAEYTLMVVETLCQHMGLATARQAHQSPSDGH